MNSCSMTRQALVMLYDDVYVYVYVYMMYIYKS